MNVLQTAVMVLASSDKVGQAFDISRSIATEYITKGAGIASVGLFLGLFFILTKIVKKAIGFAIMVGAVVFAYFYLSMNGVI